MGNMPFGMPNPPDARKQDRSFLRWLRLTDDGATRVGPETLEVPDPVYWTAYDYYMIEREARALRRDRLYTTLTMLGTRLWQLIANAARSFAKRPGRPAMS
jgi:hypothetical protein